MSTLKDYLVLIMIGRGGTSSVHLCQDKATKKDYVLKAIPKHYMVSETQQSRFNIEREIMTNLIPSTSLYLVNATASFEDEENLYLVMKYIPQSVPLYKCIWSRLDKHFTEEETKFFAAELIVAVSQFHNLGYCHRDIKSGNILIDKTGHLWLIDYGFAATPGESSRCGTPYIMAPETINQQNTGYAADCWAIGIAIYEMAVGNPPWPYHPSEEMTEILEKAESLVFPEVISNPILQDLLRKLLTVDATARLGSTQGLSEVMSHEWFSEMEWEQIHQKKAESPYQPSPNLLDRDDSDEDEVIDPEDDQKYFSSF